MTPSPEPLRDADLRILVREHQQEIWRYLRFLGCDPGEADDLTQETFLAVARRSIHRFGRGGARAYLRTVARNFFLGSLGPRGRRRATVDLETAEAAFDWYRAAEERTGESDTMMLALRTCLAELSDRARTALDLRYRDELPRGDIAARMGLSTHGVKSLLQRSYARLRVCVQRRTQHDR